MESNKTHSVLTVFTWLLYMESNKTVGETELVAQNNTEGDVTKMLNMRCDVNNKIQPIIMELLSYHIFYLYFSFNPTP
jgi:hypothetical protein